MNRLWALQQEWRECWFIMRDSKCQDERSEAKVRYIHLSDEIEAEQQRLKKFAVEKENLKANPEIVYPEGSKHD